MDREVPDGERMSPESIDRMYRSAHMLKDDENGMPCLVFNRYEFAKQIQQTLSETCIKQKDYKYEADEGQLTEDQIKQLKEGTTERSWKGLTHSEIDEAIENNQRFGGFRKVGFAYDLEEILKEKNT